MSEMADLELEVINLKMLVDSQQEEIAATEAKIKKHQASLVYLETRLRNQKEAGRNLR